MRPTRTSTGYVSAPTAVSAVALAPDGERATASTEDATTVRPLTDRGAHIRYRDDRAFVVTTTRSPHADEAFRAVFVGDRVTLAYGCHGATPESAIDALLAEERSVVGDGEAA